MQCFWLECNKWIRIHIVGVCIPFCKPLKWQASLSPPTQPVVYVELVFPIIATIIMHLHRSLFLFWQNVSHWTILSQFLLIRVNSMNTVHYTDILDVFSYREIVAILFLSCNLHFRLGFLFVWWFSKRIPAKHAIPNAVPSVELMTDNDATHTFRVKTKNSKEPLNICCATWIFQGDSRSTQLQLCYNQMAT